VTLTAKDVEEITRLLEESSFDELYLELDGVKLSLRRAGADAPAGARASASQRGLEETRPPSASSVCATPEPAPQGARDRAAASDPASHDVSAPLLGTFYRAPKPGAPPFVEVGSLVEEQTIIGIIEVMKLMNTVRAGVSGRVTEILARDGVLVEYGETLIRVGKSSAA
jgi:acetyl-CoA carboxylase biotin carboxyl carrier protein